MAEGGTGKGDKAREGAVRAFRLEESGLERVLGELEASVMEAVWRLEEASVQEVCDALGPGHNYKTVMTVMNRLVEKRLLSRRRVCKAYLYSAVESRQAFLGRVSRSVAAGLVRDFGSAAIAQFVDVVHELAPEELAMLEELIHDKVGQRRGGKG
ncbi:MAG: BlaI/MecI/CopY family transcriptional regulator [Sphingomonadaceae bacterium]